MPHRPITLLLCLVAPSALLLGVSAQPPHRASNQQPAISNQQPVTTRAFLKTRCTACHSALVKSGGLDLTGLPAKLDDPANEAQWIRIYDRVQQGEMPPKAASPLPAKEREGFVLSLGALLQNHDAARQARTGRVALRRLNRVEYENTLHDLLQIDTPLVAMLPEDASASGFDNIGSALRLSATQIESYLLAADKALDAAIDFGPSPLSDPSRLKRHLSYLDVPQIKDELAKPTGSINKDGSRFQQNYRALPDALVIFPNETFGGTLLRESRTDSEGLYRIRLSAYAYQNTGRPTVVAKLMSTNFARNRMLAAFDLIPNKPRVMEITTHLPEGELLYMSGSGCDVAPDNSHVQDIGGEKYTGTGMAVQWIEIEGPLLESWPPPSMKRIFGDVPIRPVAKPKRREQSYELVLEDPTTHLAADPGIVADRLIASFAQRAFRRPVAPKDLTRYTQLAHDALAQQGGTLESALRRAYKAILVAPEFLFLQESRFQEAQLKRPGSKGTGSQVTQSAGARSQESPSHSKVDDYALASRLSYFLWSSMPDEALLKVAAQGRLHDPATLRAQTDRMLASPKAHAFTHNFCGQWLNLRAIDATMPDQQLYPEFDDLLQQAMVGETEAFFEELLKSDLGVADLIDSDFAMLNRRLADHYGIPGVVGEPFRKVKLPANSHRGGVLTQASVLKVTANGSLSSPVVRGAWVLRRIVGRPLQPPPADAGTIQPDTRGATTIREQLAKHRRSETCAGCHKYMDPPGFALESYDVIGGWRGYYRTTQGQGAVAKDPITQRYLSYRQGRPVDASGELVDGRKFQDIDQFKRLLLDQKERVAQNLVNNLVTYATGAEITFADRAEVQAILRRAKPHAYGLRTLVHEIVQSPLFQNK